MRRGTRWAFYSGLAVGLVMLAACTSHEIKPADQLRALIYAPPGTILTTRNTVNGATSVAIITAEAAEGLQGRARLSDGTTTSFYPACWDCGTPVRIDTKRYGDLWPLALGRSTRFDRYDAEGRLSVVEIRIAAQEEISTPAGRFQTWRMEGYIETREGPRWFADVTAWWAPQPGWVVKAEAVESTGDRRSSEVTDIDLPGT